MQEKIIIITLNYNQNDYTLKCIESILESDCDNFEILLIDNGSESKAYNEIKDFLRNEPKVKLLRINKNRGYVGGINYGLEKAALINPKYFLIMNNDIIMDKHAIVELYNVGEKYNANAIISGKVYHYDKPNTLQYAGSNFSDKRYLKETYPGKDELDKGQCEEEEERDMLDDVFWLLPKKIYDDIGPYCDYYFLYAEQADYALKAVNKGYKLIYTPKAKIWHKGSLTTGDGDRHSPAVTFWRKKSSIIYLYRNIKKKYFLFYFLKTFSKCLIKIILTLLRFRQKVNKKSEIAALLGLIYGLMWILNKKQDIGNNPFKKK